jgi:hypothetical protein
MRTSARVKRQSFTRPCSSIARWQAIAARSAPALSEHTSALSTSGSIGTTRSGK